MIFTSPEPAIPIPEVPLTPFLLESAAARGDKPALIDGPSGRTLTYRGWAEAVRRGAAGLAQRGFGKGDVFAIYSPNLPEYAIAFHAVSLLGGTVTTINPLYTAAELSQQLQDARARYLVTVAPFLEKAQQAAREASVQEVFVFGEAEGATPFASLLAATGEPPAVAIDPRQDVVVLPYSSGTTGLPKGVMLTHYNLVANILQTASILDVGAHDVVLGVLPFFHIYGMVVIMNVGLHVGSTIVTLPRFDLEQFLDLIEQHRVTRAFIVPPIAVALAKHPAVDSRDLSSVRQ
ncbi:MAG TPA: AMP-binding protein, partial [Vicinamibacteria bacterium]|nr:AMP-binding protein [Vicinamibacteria bacterium]